MLKLDVTDNVVKLSLSPGDIDVETLSTEFLANKLSEAGVCCGIRNDAIANVFHQVNELQVAVEDVVVAAQIEPQNEQPAPIIQDLRNEQIAAAGDTIAKLGEITPAVDGKTVLGEVISASSAPETALTAGANTEVVDETTLKATVYGTVRGSDKEISIEPPVVVEDDGMVGAIDVYPRSSAQTPITSDMVWDSLEVAGVLYGVDNNKIETALKEAQETDSPLLHQVVANGSIETASTDARIKHFIETEQKVGEQRADGSIDFHERSTIRNVKSGVRICRWIPPIDGKPRTDVYGQCGAVASGDDIEFEAGENVELRNDDFWSLIDGAVIIKNNVVSVSEMYSFNGDIDLQSGNLQHEKGGVHIQGTVRSGFDVQAGSHIIVDNIVEDATLKCGGDVQITCGVIHAESGRIDASGTVTARFAQNARISAGESIFIDGPAMNCDLYAGSSIIVTGNKARLVGGVARATDDCRFQQLGAETGAPTLVEIGPDRKAIDALQLEIDAMQAAKDAGKEMETELEKLLKKMDKLTDSNKQSAIIDIDGIAYPGVTVKIYGAKYTFTTERSKCRVRLDEDRKIKVIQLA